MEYTANRFTKLINEVVKEQVRPAQTRRIFDVRTEESGDASVDFIRQESGEVTGKWRPAGSENKFDAYNTSLSSDNNPVIERMVAINMNGFDRMRASEGKTLSFQDRVADTFNRLELEIDDVTLNGKNIVKGIFDSKFYGSKSGTTVNSSKKFANATAEEIRKVILNSITKSKQDGAYLGKKNILLSSAILNILRTKTVANSDVTVLQHLKNNIPELGELIEVPNITDILMYEKNPAHMYAHFTYPLKQVGDIKEEGGSLTAYYVVRYAGLVIKNSKPLVKITGTV